MSPVRQGWLGGTFDPIHCGHLDVARAARNALALDVVHLVPARVPPHRSAAHAPAEQRLAMVHLAAESHDWLRVSTIEMEGAGPSYTVETLDRLAASGMDLDTLHVVTGADAFAGILSWKDAERLLTLCHFVVVSRPGHPASALRLALPTLAGRMRQPAEYDDQRQPSIFLVDAPTAPVSSTKIRALASAGSSLVGLVPPAVAAYIDGNDLYRGVA